MKLFIDTKATVFLAGGGPAPVVDYETKRPKVDRESGEPLYSVQVIAMQDGESDIITVWPGYTRASSYRPGPVLSNAAADGLHLLQRAGGWHDSADDGAHPARLVINADSAGC